MDVSDGMVEGGVILDESHFSRALGYVSNFDKPLDQILGTDKGTNTTDGDLKNGFVDANVLSYATVAGSNNNQINGEQQAYLHPDSTAPDPLMMFEKRAVATGVALVIKSRLAEPSEAGFAHFIGYYTLPNGERAQESFFTAENGFSNGPPSAWSPVVEDDGFVRFLKFPARFLSAMVSTDQRYTAPFYRLYSTVELPTGGRDRSNTPARDQSVSDQFGLVQPHHIGADINDVDASFPADPWTLRENIPGADMNGDPTPDGTTESPANQAAKGPRPEIDGGEVFGDSDTEIHQTMHHYENGHLDDDGNPAQILSKASPNPRVDDVRLPNRIGFDKTPTKIGWWILKAGETVARYTRVIDTPSDFADPLPRYEKDPEKPYLPRMVNNRAVIVGQQQYADGSPKWGFDAAIANFARNGKFVRDFVFDKATHHDENYRNTLPEYSDADEMVIHELVMLPLITDNPSKYIARVKGVLIEADGSIVNPPTDPTDPAEPPVEPPVSSLVPGVVVDFAPGVNLGMPALTATARPVNGFDMTGKTPTWSANPDVVTFDPPTSRTPTVILDDGVAPDTYVDIQCDVA